MPTRKSGRVQPSLFGAPSDFPEGFRYEPEIFSQTEEQIYVERFTTLPFRPFEFHGYLGKRRIVSFGWQYDYSQHMLRESLEIPQFLLPLRLRASVFAEVPAESFKQVLVTEYVAGAGIGWHRDKPMFEDVVAFSFLSECTLRFRRKNDVGWERATIKAQPRSVYLLRGSSRREPKQLQLSARVLSLSGDLGTCVRSYDAHYRIDLDKIFTPPFAAFHDATAHIGTLIHEAAHAVGAKHRLDRNFAERFGRDAKAIGRKAGFPTSTF